ncbi:hypothetical protein [Thiobacillus sp.]|uniref:hypothetical protein n=1 Tax=Thiobacillus sp. TaxID=924 RepID=UPI0025DD7931|nr:hypothetical protein [Thiobacillus sp.]MBT9541072.1 hypothetical protein [Thiobacillus sp.]
MPIPIETTLVPLANKNEEKESVIRKVKVLATVVAIALLATGIYWLAAFYTGYEIGKKDYWRIRDPNSGSHMHDIRLPTMCNGTEYALDTVPIYESQHIDGHWKLVRVNAARYRYTEDGWKLRSEARAFVSADIMLDQQCFSALVNTLRYWTGTFRLQLVRAGKVEMEVVKF